MAAKIIYFEDEMGNKLTLDEVIWMPHWEIEERKLRVYNANN
jgi:hypothetical protein